MNVVSRNLARWCVVCGLWVRAFMGDGHDCVMCWNPTLSAKEKMESEGVRDA